ncbi:MAG: hypothetical protein ACJ75P_08060 [Gaiellaceae bacterium]
MPQHPCLPGDDCSQPPPPPPPPAPPPPPPPPSFPACGDGWDNDGDGLIDYLSDPGCSSETDPDEYNAPEPPPPPPPPPPAPDLNVELAPTGFTTSTVATEWGFYGSRCKLQIFTQSFSQSGLYDVIHYSGSFRVCYVPGSRVVSWSEVVGDAEWVRPFSGWEWRGNAGGYPVGIRITASAVEFRYRGTAAICVLKYGCGPERHPWVTLTFFANNTMSRRVGVV